MNHVQYICANIWIQASTYNSAVQWSTYSEAVERGARVLLELKIYWVKFLKIRKMSYLYFKNLFSTFERKVSDIYIIVHGVFILIQQVLLYFSCRFWSHLNQDIGRCDCLIIFGTFLAVASFNGLVVVAKPPTWNSKSFY